MAQPIPEDYQEDEDGIHEYTFESSEEESQESGRSRGGIFGIITLLLTILAIGIQQFFGIDMSTLTGEEPPRSAEVEVEQETQPTVNERANDDEFPFDRSPSPDYWYEIYFTAPTCPPLEERAEGIDEFIADDIRFAEYQVDIAGFDIDSKPIIDALIELEEQAISVRVVVDNEHTPAATINRLRRNGISVIEDKRSAFMHNKFIIIDGRYVWTGSLNFTTTGVYCNNNNIVRFENYELAANYRREMDEMYDERSFGPRSPNRTPKREFEVAGTFIENYFAPEEDIAFAIADEVDKAQEEILFMAFSYTSDEIMDAMFDRADDGVDIRGIYEARSASGLGSTYGDMRVYDSPNIQVRVDGNPRTMHHKVIIIDGKTVVFGSYNFTDNAENSNDENLMIVHDSEFASFFIEEFEILWEEGE